jgi:sarcosine oxidase subunit gamma
MIDAPRSSPVPSLSRAVVRKAVMHGMTVPVELEADARSSELPALITDASCLPRAGVKGPNAAAWLTSQGVQLPAANHWRYHDELRIARLGRSEFLLEAAAHGSRVAQLKAVLAPAAGLYPVLRQDAVIWLAGPAAASVLRQLVTFDFTCLPAGDDAVLLTQLGGVSATLLWQPAATGRCYSIYCDASYGSYLWTTLLALVAAEGGAAVSFDALAPTALASATAPSDESNPTVSES